MEGDDAEEGERRTVQLAWILITATRLAYIFRTSPDGPKRAAVRSLDWAERVAGRTEKGDY
jgi:hypothetical protein